MHRLTLSRALPAIVLLALLVPAVALGAAKAGSYSGTSSVKIPIVVGYTETTRTDKGKVAFKVSGAKVTGFKVTGQQAFCGGQSPVVDVRIASIKLSAAGYTDRVSMALATSSLPRYFGNLNHYVSNSIYQEHCNEQDA